MKDILQMVSSRALCESCDFFFLQLKKYLQTLCSAW